MVIPPALFGFPGPQRDRLVASILSGAKTATTGLYEEHRRSREPIPSFGDRFQVLDSSGRGVAVIETTSVEVLPLDRVGEAFAHDEGEGFEDAAAWRVAHIGFFSSVAMREALGAPTCLIDEETLVVCERFRLVQEP